MQGFIYLFVWSFVVNAEIFRVAPFHLPCSMLSFHHSQLLHCRSFCHSVPTPFCSDTMPFPSSSSPLSSASLTYLILSDIHVNFSSFFFIFSTLSFLLHPMLCCCCPWKTYCVICISCCHWLYSPVVPAFLLAGCTRQMHLLPMLLSKHLVA